MVLDFKGTEPCSPMLAGAADSHEAGMDLGQRA